MLSRTLKSMLILPALLAAMAGAPAQAADSWPSRPIRMVVPFAPGGSNDVIARKLAERMTPILGQTVVVENRGGAGGVIGSNAVANSVADGYTLLFVSGSLATSASVQKTPYDPLKAFTAISRVASAPFVIVTREGFPAKTLPQLIDYARANPGKINYGSAGLGDSTQLATELFSSTAGIKMQAVGYNGISLAQLDVLAGRLDLVITTVAAIRGTAVDKLPKVAFTTNRRDAEYPDVPTAKESGLDYVVDVWWGVFGPAKLPADIVSRVNGAVAQVAAQPDFAAFLKSSGAQAAPSSADELQQALSRDLARWTETAERAGIRQK
ncbi:Bug family tripartite tricarboxylate transporter substrate binding protein [Bordetella genomosp. 13]|uniref:Bug family tripartite tricarboxylate transporter substrate binding protein n=1 Tax=Bordetella genomosp. 13 TaxID=463040 RepID=UPI0011A75F97|nr:tripartite tricarboxylate transporter substrate-binding protein [Bordetella genomosp. 13]